MGQAGGAGGSGGSGGTGGAISGDGGPVASAATVAMAATVRRALLEPTEFFRGLTAGPAAMVATAGLVPLVEMAVLADSPSASVSAESMPMEVMAATAETQQPAGRVVTVPMATLNRPMAATAATAAIPVCLASPAWRRWRRNRSFRC